MKVGPDGAFTFPGVHSSNLNHNRFSPLSTVWLHTVGQHANPLVLLNQAAPYKKTLAAGLLRYAGTLMPGASVFTSGGNRNLARRDQVAIALLSSGSRIYVEQRGFNVL